MTRWKERLSVFPRGTEKNQENLSHFDWNTN